MYTLFVILIVVAAVLMIGIVLIQESKGGGLSSGFSGGNQIMGVRKTTDFVEKTTWFLAGAMVVISVLCSYSAPTGAENGSIVEKMSTQQPQTSSSNLPGFSASAPAADAKAEAADAPKAEAADAPKATEEAPKAEAPAADAKAETPAAPAEEKK